MSSMELAQVTIQDESGNHAIPCYRGQLNDGRVICVRPECFHSECEEEDHTPENWIKHIDKESIFIEGRYAGYGDQEYTREMLTLKAGHPWEEPDWQEEVMVAKGTGLGYWKRDARFCPTHIKSGQGLLQAFRTEEQARAFIERLSEYVDWNQDIQALKQTDVWFYLTGITNRIAYAVRRQYPANVPVEAQ